MTPIEVTKTDYSEYGAKVLSVEYMMTKDGVQCDVTLLYTGQCQDLDKAREMLLKIEPPMIDRLSFAGRVVRNVNPLHDESFLYLKWCYKEVDRVC